MNDDPFISRDYIPPAPEDAEEVVEGIVEEKSLVPASYYGEPQKQPPPRRPRRRTRGVKIPRFSLFAISVSLVVAGVFFTLLNVAELPADVREQWPIVSLAAAALWSLIALIRRQSTAFVAGTAIAGVSLSFLLDNQNIADFEQTVFGVLLIMLGLSVVIRGLLIRPRVVRSS